MKSIRHILALTGTLAAAAFFQNPAAHAQTVSPIPAPTIITTAPYTITTAGYYQLGANLTVSNTSGNIITIAASNVTLDFAGHYISGPVNAGTSLNGVYADEEGNLNIQNGTVAYCHAGIYLTGNGSSTSLNINQQVTNMLVSYCYYSGIYLEKASYSSANNNRVSFIGQSTNSADTFGIGFNGGTGNSADTDKVISVTATGSGQASGILGTSNATVTNCIIATISSPSGTAVGIGNVIFADNNTITGSQYGIDGAVKYKDNLTNGCTTPFNGGTAVGNNS